MKMSKYEVLLTACGLAVIGCIVIYSALSSPPLNTPAAYFYASQIESAISSASGAETESKSAESSTPEPSESNQSNALEQSGAEQSNTSEQSKSGSSVPVSALVNINTADSEELQTLDGIGPAMAQRIIDYREKNGGFLTKEELMLVEGIGEKRYNAIKNSVTIE